MHGPFPGFTAARPILLIAIVAATSIGATFADVSGYLELTGAELETSDAPVEGQATESRTWSVTRRVYLSFRHRLFPKITVSGGGLFDDVDGSTRLDDDRFDTSARRLRPYLSLRREGRHQYQEIRYFRDQARTSRTDAEAFKTIRDSLSGTIGWRQPGLPVMRASFFRSHDRDAEKRFRDRASTGGDLTLSHQFREPIRVSYRGSLSDEEDRLANNSIRTTSHVGTIHYDDAWLDRRITLNAGYSLATRGTEVINRGTGEVFLPLFPLAGLVSIPRDETPLDGTLIEDATLIDDERQIGGAVDIGLPGIGEDDRPWAIGVELEPGTLVNTMFVWVTVDEDLREPTWRSFTWQVFTSENNRDWAPRESVRAREFDQFLKRFEIRFSDVTTRYIKLVVSPLRTDDPFAAEYPDILIAEIDAAEASASPTRSVTRRETSRTANASTRIRLIADRDFYYDLSFSSTDSDRRGQQWQMSNGLSYDQALNDVYGISGRVSHNQDNRPERDEKSVAWAAALSAVPVPRLRYMLSVSGRNELVENPNASDNVSLFLYGVAALYQGVDVQLGIGRTWEDGDLGARAESTQVTASARLAPGPAWNIGLSYEDTSAERFSAADVAASDTFSKSAEVNVAYTPFPTVYLYGSRRLEWLQDDPRDTVTVFVLSWTPLPGGSLRLGINYDETRRTDFDYLTRVVGPSLRWTFNPRSWIQLAMQDVSETSTQRRYDNRIFSGTLRWGF